MPRDFTPYEERLRFQELRDSLEKRCKQFWPDQVVSLAHVLAYHLHRVACSPDHSCGEITLLDGTKSLGELRAVHLTRRAPAGNSEVTFYYTTANHGGFRNMLPLRTLQTPYNIFDDAIDGDETADMTDRPLLIESTHGSIIGLAPSITPYAHQALFRKNYLAAMRKRNKDAGEVASTEMSYSNFHETLKFLQSEMAQRYGTGGTTNVPDLYKVPLPIERKALALAPVVATACSESGPLVLHRGTRRCGRLLGAEYKRDTLLFVYNTAKDHERRCDLVKEGCVPLSAYWRIPNNQEGSITIVGKQDRDKVQYLIAPARGSISKHRAARERLLQDVSSVCMDLGD